MLWLTLLVSMFGLLFCGVWIGAALGLTGLVVMLGWGGGFSLLGTTVWNAVNIYSLTAIVGFLFMGQILAVSGLGARMFSAVLPLLARLPGKLLHINIVLSAMFAAVLGVSTANAVLVGSLSIPELRKRHYGEELLLGTICMGGTLGILIPPSAPFILYGAMAQVSIAGLFAAGTVPGILLTIAFMTYIAVKGILTPSIAPAKEESLPFGATLRSLLNLWPLILVSGATLVPIYIGWVTPTEASGVGAIVSLIVSRFVGQLTWRIVKEAMFSTIELSGMIFFLVVGAMVLSTCISSLGIPRALVSMTEKLHASQITIFCFITLIYLVLGCFIDTLSLMIMSLPFVVPVLNSYGFDMIWFGVILILLIEIGLVTPPVGMNLFVTQAVAGPETSVATVARGSLPFVMITLVLLAVFVIWPEVVTFFPHALGYQ